MTLGQWEALAAGAAWCGLVGFYAGDWYRRRRARRREGLDEGLRALRQACWRARRELERVDRIASELLEGQDVSAA